MKIAVVGLGYVGLPLCLQFARSCVNVVGIDVDPTKVQLLNNGQSYIKHIEQPAIAELLRSGKFSATTDFSLIKEVEAVRSRRTSQRGPWWFWNRLPILERQKMSCALYWRRNRG